MDLFQFISPLASFLSNSPTGFLFSSWILYCSILPMDYSIFPLYYLYSVGVFSAAPEKIFSHRFFGPFSSISHTFRGGPERNSISGSQIKKRALFRNKTRDNHKKHLTWKISLDFAAEERLMRQKCLPDTKIVNGCERCNGDVGDFLLLLEYFPIFPWRGAGMWVCGNCGVIREGA